MDEFWIYLDRFAPSITPLRRYSTAAGAMEAAENECAKTGIEQVVLKAERCCKRAVVWYNVKPPGIPKKADLTKEEREALQAGQQAMMAGRQFNPPKEY